MIKLTVLGTSGAFPEKNHECSGYLLEMGGEKIVLDLGNGTLSNLQNHVMVDEISAIFISHMHPDHFADIYSLRYLLEYGYPQDHAVELWGVPKFKETILSLQPDAVDAYDKLFNFKETEKKFSIGPLSIETIFTKHPILTNAFRITDGRQTFVYTADTGFTEKLVEFSSGADLLLSECTYDTGGPLTELHMRSDEVGTLASKAEIGKVVISHFWPGVDRGKAKADVESVFDGEVHVANENETIAV